MAQTPAEVIQAPQELPKSLRHMFKTSVDNHRNELAFTACHQSPNRLSNLLPTGCTAHSAEDYLEWTYDELNHASLRVSKSMLDAGVQRGDTMVMLQRNGVEHIIGAWVSAILQLTLIPLDPGELSASRRENLNYFMAEIKPQIVFVPDVEGATAMDEVLESTGLNSTIKFSASTGEFANSGWHALEEISSVSSNMSEEGELGQDTEVDCDGKRTVVVLFTSGTSTGRPKGCPISLTTFLTWCKGNVVSGEMPQTSWLVPSVNFRAVGMTFLFLAATQGVRIVLPAASFSPSTFTSAVVRTQVDVVLLFPAVLNLLTREIPSTHDRQGVRQVFVGGDIITPDIVEKAQKAFPNALVRIGSGMTEAARMLGFAGADLSKPIPLYHGIHTVGLPGPSACIRICSEDGKVLNRGEHGEMHVGGPVVIQRYRNDVQSELFYHDDIGNWMKTGDKTVMNDEGFIFILGRIKDIIKRNAVSISPAVLEATLNRHEGINAAILGVPDSIYGEVPVAVLRDLTSNFLGGSSNEAKERVKSIIEQELGPDFALADVFFLSELGMDDFPLNPSGKVEKVKLRDAMKSRNAD